MNFFQGPQNSQDMEIVIDEYRKIQEHNEKFEQGLESYSRKIWKNSDLDESTRQKITGGFNLANISDILYTPTPIKGVFKSSFFASLFNAKPSIYPVGPKSFDWRDRKVVAPVQDQGFECSSCYAFSAIGAIEGQLARNTGKLVKLSEQQLIDCNFNSITGNWGICFNNGC
jgi:cathepsin L